MKKARLVEAILLIERDGAELRVDLTGQLHPGERMVRYYRDGSGHPGAPPYVSDIEAELDGVPVELTDPELEAAQDRLLEIDPEP